MAKITVEPVWLSQAENETVTGSITGWFSAISRCGQNGVDAMRHFVSAFIRRQQDIESTLEKSLKDEFFQRGCLGRQNKVPDRVWKRHSALLVYREQVYRQQVDREGHCE